MIAELVMAKLTKLFVRATCHNDVVIRMEFDRAVRDVEVYYQTFITEPFMRLVDIKLTNFTYRNNRTIVSVEKFPNVLGNRYYYTVVWHSGSENYDDPCDE